MTVTMLSRRRVLGIGLGAVVLGTAAACGGGKKPPAAQTGSGNGGKEYTGPNVSLAFWNGLTGGDGDTMKTLVSQFNTEHPNIKVTMTAYQWADYYQKVPAAVSAGSGPDVGLMHIDHIATNAARRVITPLDDVVTSLGLSESDFAPVIWKAGEYKGTRYAIPLDTHPLGFYYNKKLMTQAGLDPAEPPQTHDEYMAALEALKAKGIQGHWVPPFQFTGTFQFESLLWQFGGDLFAADGSKATFDSDAGVQAMTWLVDLVGKGYSPKNVGQDADVTAFQNNKNAFNWNGIWMINTYGQVNGLEWGVAPIPQIGTQRGAWANSHNFVLFAQRSADNNKIDAGKVFINWVSQHSADWAKGGQVPARNSVRTSADFTALAMQSEFAKQLDDLHFPPAVPGIEDVAGTVDTALSEAVLGKKTPKQALADAAAKANKLLADNKAKYGA